MAIFVEHEAWLLQMEGMCVEDAIYMSFLQCMIGSKYRSAQRLAFGVMGEYSDNVFNKFRLFSLAKDMKMAACYNDDNEADYAAIMSNIMYWMFFWVDWDTQLEYTKVSQLFLPKNINPEDDSKLDWAICRQWRFDWATMIKVLNTGSLGGTIRALAYAATAVCFDWGSVDHTGVNKTLWCEDEWERLWIEPYWR